MLISKIYKKGIGRINEDAYTTHEKEHLYAVMDGATGLDGIPGHIASHAVAEVFKEHTSSDSLFNRLKNANQIVQQRNTTYAAAHLLEDSSQGFYDIDKAKRSSTGVAAIQFNENHTFFNYVQAGDCMIFLQYKDGTIRTLTHDHIHALDHQVFQVIQQIQQNAADQQLNFDDIRPQILPLLIENRSKLNTLDGYGIIDGSQEAMRYVEHGKVMVHNVSKILLLSDGLQVPVVNPEENPWEMAAQVAFDHGLERLLNLVDEKEHADPDGIRYPRFKFADDKTALLMTL